MKLYMKGEGGDYQEVMTIGEISDIKLTESERTEIRKALGFLDDAEISFTVNITENNTKRLMKMMKTKGQRNAEVLRRDGYLSSENAER